MIQSIPLAPGVTLRCFEDSRFKQGCLSLQFIRPMCRREAAMNALLPAVLLRGSRNAPDLRDITLLLDDLYGAAVGTLVRRVGDYQTTGLSCSFMEDRFAMAGDRVLEPMAAFLGELLLEPVLQNGVFRQDYVEGEKRNLIAAIAAQRNDKRSYAMAQMLRHMCGGDSYGIPRLGEIPEVEAVDARTLFDHYQRVLKTSPMEIFYVGSAKPEQVAALLKPLCVNEHLQTLPAQRPLQPALAGEHCQQMELTQGRLCMGFTTPVTVRDKEFASMQVLNSVFGGGMTSKLFMQVREKLSLCYDISSGYHGSKGLITVTAGIEFAQKDVAQAQILAQLEACRQGDILEEKLISAKQGLITQLQAVHDTPGAIENYYATGVLSGLAMTPEDYIRAVEQVTLEQVVQAAKSISLHTVYFLKGVQE